MSEEEKKAIERIEDTFYQDLGKGINKFQKITLYEDGITDIRKLLNLLEKLQKEIEGKNAVIDSFKHTEKVLTEQLDKQQKEIEDLNEIKQQICNEELITQDYVQDNFIAKDKIREAIENRNIELYADEPDNDFIPFDEVIDTLKELLEEN